MPAVAVLFAVATSKVTPPGDAGASSVTLKVNVVVPRSPSVRETSLIDSPTCANAAVVDTSRNVTTNGSRPGKRLLCTPTVAMLHDKGGAGARFANSADAGPVRGGLSPKSHYRPRGPYCKLSRKPTLGDRGSGGRGFGSLIS